jgi:hypothetical protein
MIMKFYKRIDLTDIVIMASEQEPTVTKNLLEISEEEYMNLLNEINKAKSEQEV